MTALGMIGAGRWGSNWIRTLANLAEVELRWVCDVSPAALDQVRGRLPHVRTTTELDDVLNDSAVEGLVIASIAPTHYDVARRAILAGKHVMVEKPMTLTTSDAMELTALAQEKGRVLMVGHLLEYHPIMRRLREMIDEGELGEVLYLYSQRLNLGTFRGDENCWWSLAPHDITMACRLLGGTPVSIQCRGVAMVYPGIEDVVWGLLEFPGGRLAHVHTSRIDPHKTRTLTVVGTRKCAVFNDMAPNKLVIHGSGFQRSVNPDGGPDLIVLRQGPTVMPAVDMTEPLVLEAKHFVDCIRHRRWPLSDGVSGTMVVSVLEYGQRSLERGSEVVLIPPAIMPMRRSA